jgi:hypothetical protein
MRLQGKGFSQIVLVQEVGREAFIKKLLSVVETNNIVDYTFSCTDGGVYTALVFLGEKF